MKSRKNQGLLFISILVFCLIIPFLSFSANPGQFTGKEVIISEDVNGPVFASGENVVINGNVNGPVFASGNTVEINGRVDGIVFSGASETKINGQVQGPVFAAGNKILINSNIDGELFAAGNQIAIEAPSILSRDAFLAGNNILINSEIKRHSFAAGNTLEIGAEGKVGGNLYYSTSVESSSVQDKVGGEVFFTKVTPAQEPSMQSRIASFIFSVITGLVSFGLLGFVLGHFSKDRWVQGLLPITEKPLITLGIGAVVGIATIPILILISITMVLAPFAAVFGLLFALIILLSTMIVSFSIARKIGEQQEFFNKFHWIIGFALVYIVLRLLMIVPYIGWIIRLLVIFFAIGNVLIALFQRTEGQDKKIESTDSEVFLYENK